MNLTRSTDDLKSELKWVKQNNISEVSGLTRNYIHINNNHCKLYRYKNWCNDKRVDFITERTTDK